MKEEELLEFLKECFPKDWWMDDNDQMELITECLKQSNITLANLLEAIDIGIKNGYSAEFQLELMREVFKKQIANE